MSSYIKTHVSPYDPTKLTIHSILRPEDDLLSNCRESLKKLFILMTLRTSLMKSISSLKLILTLVLLSTRKPLQESDRSTENGITFPDPVKNPSAFPATINISVLLRSSRALIAFWTSTINGTWFQQLFCHSTIPMIDTLCPICTLNQQLTNLEQTHFRCSLHCERWTVKWRDWASALHSFKEVTYRTDEWTKPLLRLKSWVISGNPEQWMEFRRLWWAVSVFKCRYLFHLFGCYCLLVKNFLFFRKIYFFCSLSLTILCEK